LTAGAAGGRLLLGMPRGSSLRDALSSGFRKAIAADDAASQRSMSAAVLSANHLKIGLIAPSTQKKLPIASPDRS
jgi:hypothetical protein